MGSHPGTPLRSVPSADAGPSPRSPELRRALEAAFGEPVHVDPFDFIGKVLAGLFRRQPHMSGDQRNRLLPSELRAVNDTAHALVRAMEAARAGTRVAAGSEAQAKHRDEPLSPAAQE